MPENSIAELCSKYTDFCKAKLKGQILNVMAPAIIPQETYRVCSEARKYHVSVIWVPGWF